MLHAALGRALPVLLCSMSVCGSTLAATASSSPDRTGILTAARALPAGGRLQIDAVPWSSRGSLPPTTLDLARFEVFSPTARIVVHTDGGDRLLPIPANIYLRGRIDGDPLSRVVLSVLETGEIRGLATSAGRTWLIGARADEPVFQVREIDGSFELEQAGGGFRCALDDLGPEAFRAGDASGDSALAAILDPPAVPHPATPETGFFDHTAVIAIETDNEFLALAPIGGNTTTAANYIADLVAYSSSIYTDELQTSWSLGFVSLWQTTDPWQQTNPSCALIDFGRYWNNNHTGVVRTVTHFLSGKSTNAGIAWVGVLCSGAFSIDAAQVATGCSPALTGVSNWGGGYGVTSGVDANFNINSPSIVWDIMAFTHEIGHNFNSPHTHCYEGLEGNAAAIDHCYGSQSGTGCYSGSTSLPSGCPGSGQNCGTIMSYCHLISPGMSNTSLSLGLGHPYGVQPSRVPTRMRSHVVSRAASNPACLAPIDPLAGIFSNGFQSGNTSAWSATVP